LSDNNIKIFLFSMNFKYYLIEDFKRSIKDDERLIVV